MKTRLQTALLVCFSVLLTLAVVLPLRATARDRASEHITFSEPVIVAGTLLKPDTYRVVWDGEGSQVQVSFMKGSKTMVTTTANLVLEESMYDGAFELKTSGDNSKVLTKIKWKKEALIFEPSS